MKRGQDQQPVPAQQGLADLETAEGESSLHRPGTPPPRRLALSPPRRSGRNGGSGNPCRTLGAMRRRWWRRVVLCCIADLQCAGAGPNRTLRSTTRKSGRGLPHSKTLARLRPPAGRRKVLECGSPLPLSGRASAGRHIFASSHLRAFAPSVFSPTGFLAHLPTCPLAGSKTLARLRPPAGRRKVLECGSPLPLSGRASTGRHIFASSHLRTFAPSRLRCSHLLAFWPTGSLAF